MVSQLKTHLQVCSPVVMGNANCCHAGLVGRVTPGQAKPAYISEKPHKCASVLVFGFDPCLLLTLVNVNLYHNRLVLSGSVCPGLNLYTKNMFTSVQKPCPTLL